MTSKLAPISTYAPFIDCPACKGLGLVNPSADPFDSPWYYCDKCDGTGQYYPPLVPIRYEVRGKHILKVLAIVGFVLFVIVLWWVRG